MNSPRASSVQKSRTEGGRAQPEIFVHSITVTRSRFQVIKVLADRRICFSKLPSQQQLSLQQNWSHHSYKHPPGRSQIIWWFFNKINHSTMNSGSSHFRTLLVMPFRKPRGQERAPFHKIIYPFFADRKNRGSWALFDEKIRYFLCSRGPGR